MKIGFIGVGKLGKESAEVMAEKHDVIGYDINTVEPETSTFAPAFLAKCT